MISTTLKKLFGSRNERILKKYSSVLQVINNLEPTIHGLTDVQLQEKTQEFKERIKKGSSLEAILPEAFAVVREASIRIFNMRHYDEQIIGGIVLHYGKIAEMRTGEGKTLMATLPVFLNALNGKGVHVITVNDYLASRDAESMGKLYQFLGLTVGVIGAQVSTSDKKKAYLADITYGTNNEFGFDYLRDNMASHIDDLFQRPLEFAIIDEVDSILIDEARTPLIISGDSEGDVNIYNIINSLVPVLTRQETETGEGDYWVDEKAKKIFLSESGHEKAEELLVHAGIITIGHSLYDVTNISLVQNIYSALRAQNLYHLDQNYVVKDGEIVIVDEHTGRLMTGRRWSDGLHQAVEAKEHVLVKSENQTLASVTFQNYFRMYHKLSGMTGTADTEAFEFQQIYNLETVVIPPHRPTIRIDNLDKVYLSVDAKFQAVLLDIKDCHKKGQPVLVGTTSIEVSEQLSALLQKENLYHQVLNAKQHAHEASVIAQAGMPYMITIATNMAGRGTDIVLGGNISDAQERIRNNAYLTDDEKEEHIALNHYLWKKNHQAVIRNGGLHIIGTERHESRRVDNQLRGRSGRQGDPGSSRFYLSIDDSLLRLFASDRMSSIMKRISMPEGEAIEHPMISNSIEKAQCKVESRNFDMRKQILEYDDVSNEQRKAIYQQRMEILKSSEISETIHGMRDRVIEQSITQFIIPGSMMEQWDLSGLEQHLSTEFHLSIPLVALVEQDDSLDEVKLRQRIILEAHQSYHEKVEQAGDETMLQYSKTIVLQHLDHFWKEHLFSLDHLRQFIHLRGYAQKNPKQEYKREAFELFSLMLDAISYAVTQSLMQVVIRHEYNEMETIDTPLEETIDRPIKKNDSFIARNDLCPCGSNKRYKNCHGALETSH